MMSSLALGSERMSLSLLWLLEFSKPCSTSRSCALLSSAWLCCALYPRNPLTSPIPCFYCLPWPRTDLNLPSSLRISTDSPGLTLILPLATLHLLLWSLGPVDAPLLHPVTSVRSRATVSTCVMLDSGPRTPTRCLGARERARMPTRLKKCPLLPLHWSLPLQHPLLGPVLL